MKNSYRKKVLLIAMGNSVHTVRWVSLLSELDCEVFLFNSFTVPFVTYSTEYHPKVKCYNFQPQSKKYFKTWLCNPFKYTKATLQFNQNVLKAALAPAVREREVRQLANLINENDFDLIHTLHTQTSAALLDAALPYLKKKCPKWVNTVWGSDLYLHQWVQDSRNQLMKLLPRFDYYWGEGRRDYSLARELGFEGSFLPPVPGFGGFDMNQVNAIEYVPPSKRNRILVKGYQNVVGRATVAFRALELCSDLLGGYEIDLFSFENEIVPAIATIFSQKCKVKVNCISGVPYNEILKMHASSRCCIALSTSDGLPSTFIESMAFGEFPIQSNTSMAYEWIEDGKTAFLVPPEDEYEVANAIRKALTDDELVDRAGEVNRQTIQKYLDNEKVKGKVCAVYNGLLNGEPLLDPNPDSKTIHDEETIEKNSEPLVSVITLTYAHEKFIAQALDGITSQKTDFQFELIVCDDHSPDSTAEIVKHYSELYPDIIRPIIREKNIGALPNFIDVIARSRGKYVAICDGDDYWTDTYKLQKQVDFLESHPEYSVCCHPVRVFYEDGSQPDQIINPLSISSQEAQQRGYLTIHDLIKLNTVASLSTMLRWQIPRNLPDWMRKYKVGDYPILLFHADKGDVGVLPDVMGSYRKHSGGSWWNHNTVKDQVLAHLALLNDINKQLEGRYQKDFDPIFNYITTVELPKFKEESRANVLEEPQLQNVYEEPQISNFEKLQENNDVGAPIITSEEVVHIMKSISFRIKFKRAVKRIIKKTIKFILPHELKNRLYISYFTSEIIQARDAQISALNEALKQLEEKLQSISEPIEALDERVNEQDKALKQLEEKVQLMPEPIKALDERVIEQDKALKQLEEKLQHMPEPVEALDERVNEQDKALKQLEEKLQSISEPIEALDNRVDAQNEVLSQVESGLRLLTSKNDLLWDGVKSIVQINDGNSSLNFKKVLTYYLATGNFNEFYNNYDEVFADPEQVNKWISSVKQDFTKNVKACMEAIPSEDLEGLSQFYEFLSSSDSKDLLARLIAWRYLGFTKVKLISDVSVACELDFYEKVDRLALSQYKPISEIKFDLRCYDLSKLGYPIRCYTVPSSIVMEFIRRQYENEFLKVEKGDVVLDCGACWGDTSLFFAEHCGFDGKVYAFEFIDSNKQIFRRNMELNPVLAPTIELVSQPVSDKSGMKVPKFDNGTSSTIKPNTVDSQIDTDFVDTISIDDFVHIRKLSQLNFIKMDIEGSETDAIMGAKESIAHFRPKLAIAIYHKPDDIWRIPLLIKNICPEYRFFVKHNSRSSMETVLLAVVDNNQLM